MSATLAEVGVDSATLGAELAPPIFAPALASCEGLEAFAFADCDGPGVAMLERVVKRGRAVAADILIDGKSPSLQYLHQSLYS